MNFQFGFPEWLLLAFPVAWVWHRYLRVPGLTGWLRLAFLFLIVVALSSPQWNRAGNGMDLIVVVDRSRSMGAELDRSIRDLIHDLEGGRKEGDRIAVVTFGGNVSVERELSRDAVLGEYTQVIDVDGSDLNEALLVALDRRTSPDRAARILVLSDGQYNGASPLYAARRAREEGIPIDFRHFGRGFSGDIAIDAIDVPQESALDEPFQFSVVVSAEQESRGTVVVRRNGSEIARRTAELQFGINRLLFRDRIPVGGMHEYTAELITETSSLPDPVTENNRAEAIVRVRSAPALLLISHDGQAGNIGTALTAAKIPFDVASPTEHPLTLDSLEKYRAVVLENIPADALGRLRMERLAQFVEDLGGGLMMTGGRQSFGSGGYYKSPLEELLPVALDSLEETRRSRAAIAIALDRSGSMAVPVAGGKTKMDLANIGTAECVRLLNHSDRVAVIAVDSAAHVVQPLVDVSDPQGISSKVLGIESMGGGIFVHNALVAAGSELVKAKGFPTRHIILFSDAADSEEPGDYRSLLQKYTAAGITVSVIGLGSDTDPDADLLKDIASLGGGNIEFTDDPEDLPRLFAQDTMNMTRNMFLTTETEEVTGFTGAISTELYLLGELPPTQEFPSVDGYNWTFLKPEATAGVVSTDDKQAPFSAFWYRGLGRVAAIPVELDGTYSGSLPSWDGFTAFVAMHARWLLGDEQNSDVFVAVTPSGLDAAVQVELDPDRPDDQRNVIPDLVVVPPGKERTETIQPDLVWTGPDTLEARFRLSTVGTWRTLVRTGDRDFAIGPAVSLPYSPEYMLRTDMPEGDALLNQLSELSGGTSRMDLIESLEDRLPSRGWSSLLPWLCGAATLLLVVEIAGRRWNWWDRIAARRSQYRDSGESMPVESLSSTARARKARRAKPSQSGKPESNEAGDYKPVQPKSPANAPPDATRPAVDVFAKAKEKAKRRQN